MKYIKTVDEFIKESVNEKKDDKPTFKDAQEEGDKFTLKDGSNVYVIERTFPGMVGEPISILNFYTEDGKEVEWPYVKAKLKPKDKKIISKWLKDLEDDNHASAVNWTI